MIGGHYGEIYKICKNFSEPEKQLVVMTIPTPMLEAELERRSNHYSDMLDELYSILNNSSVETLDQAEETVKALKTVLKTK